MLQISYLMENHRKRDALGNHLKDQLFHLVHWLSILLSLRRTSQESINLERKFYLNCFSDTLCMRWEFGRVTYWLQTLRSWKRWTHLKSPRKDSMPKRWYFPKKMEHLFSSRRWTNQTFWRRSRPENIHLDKGTSISRRKSRRFSWRIRRVSSTSSRRISRCRWSDKWLLVHVRKLHIPPSRWTKSQTLLAERRIIPYSTKYTELLTRIWMLSKSVASMIIGMSMGQEICLIIGQVSLSLLYWKRNFQTDICGPGRHWRDSS